jgi:hypothetical protein
VNGEPAILDVPAGMGRVILFSFNPLHRYLSRNFPDQYGGIEAPEGPENVARGQSAEGASTPGIRENDLIPPQGRQQAYLNGER